MKKQTAKKRWLLGLLVGLVMLVGVSPAMAGYILVGNLFTDPCGSSITYNSQTFTYTSTNVLKIDGSPATSYDKFEQIDKQYENNEGESDWNNNWFGTKDTGSTFTTTSKFSGTWDSNGEDIMFFVVKAGSCPDGYAALYAWDGTGSMTSHTFDLSTDLTWLSDYASTIGATKAISHIELNQVPIPGTIWLLGSGLSALMVARRRKKQA
jgi:hypothetical protein